MRRNVLAAALAALVLWTAGAAQVARAQLTVVAQWRLGEDDPKAAADQPVTESVPKAPAKLVLRPDGQPKYSNDVSDRAAGSKLSVKFDGQSYLQRGGLAGNLKDNFVAEAFVKPDTDEGFHIILQYGSGAHGWSLIRNGKGYQVLLGGIALVGWSNDQPANQWAHVAVARADGVTRFYFNGQPMGESNARANDADEKAKFVIGANNEGGDKFAGLIDEVRVATFPAGGFDAKWLMINDPDGKNAAQPAPRAAGRTPPPDEAALARNETADAYILFTGEQPVMKGMTFDRGGLAFRQVDTDDGPRNAWVVQAGTARDVPWARSLYVDFTDPTFRNRAQPVVDIEVEYMQSFDAPVELRADTEAGGRKVGDGWGRDRRFKTFRARIDDGVFNATASPNEDNLGPAGHDLRVNSFGTDFAIRAIRVYRYDLSDKPDFRRLVRFDGLTTDNEFLLFDKDEKQRVDHNFTNLSKLDAKLRYTLSVVDRFGKERASFAGDFTVPARGKAALPVTFDTAGLLYGVYNTKLRVTSAADGAAVFERDGGFAVFNHRTDAGRANDGEFLYGLDTSLHPAFYQQRLLKWARFMGVDILRHGFSMDRNLDEVAEKLKVYESFGFRHVFMCDPPRTQDEKQMIAEAEANARFLEELARRYPQFQYYELGNEPDLTFFYPGPIANYVRVFHIMSDGVRRGNPNAVVMNGGLCFAGKEGYDRAVEFIKLVDASKLGAWAYHGHGPGMESERHALVRIRDLVRAAGKMKPFVETESGVAAKTGPQELVQARTVVQKMTYAQSEGLPLFLFFRLLMFEEPYGMLYSDQEPRPAVISYAAMTRQLRHLSFQSTLSPVPQGVTAYTFANKEGTEHAVVLWAAGGTGGSTLRLRVPPEASPQDVRLVDLFGNASPLKVGADGTFVVASSEDPMYVRWKTAAKSDGAVVVPSVIDVPGVLAVREKGDDVIPVTVRAPQGAALAGTLKVESAARNVTFPTTELPVTAAAGAAQTLAVPIALTPATGASVTWPQQWTVFLHADADKVDFKQVQGVPSSLPRKGGGEVAGQRTLLRNHRIDFEQLGGKLKEHECAVIMATVDSPIDQEVVMGASADWWMAWFVNGQPAFDTLQSGNGGGYSIVDHTFTIRLKQGRNVIAAKCLSGSQGWKVLIGAPAEVAEMLAGTAGTNEVKLSLVAADGAIVDTQTVKLKRVPALQPWPAGDGWTKLDDWQSQQPDAVLMDNVFNRYAIEPDSRRWWQGPNDLSGAVWFRQAGPNEVVVVAAITDDVQVPALGDVETADGLRLLASDAAGRVLRVDVPGDNGDPAAKVTGGEATAKAHVERAGTTTFYQVRLTTPADRAPQFVDVVAFDADGNLPGKQRVSLSPTVAGNEAPKGDHGVEGWFRVIRP
jgi:hypothetical protein